MRERGAPISLTVSGSQIGGYTTTTSALLADFGDLAGNLRLNTIACSMRST